MTNYGFFAKNPQNFEKFCHWSFHFRIHSQLHLFQRSVSQIDICFLSKFLPFKSKYILGVFNYVVTHYITTTALPYVILLLLLLIFYHYLNQKILRYYRNNICLKFHTGPKYSTKMCNELVLKVYCLKQCLHLWLVSFKTVQKCWFKFNGG